MNLFYSTPSCYLKAVREENGNYLFLLFMFTLRPSYSKFCETNYLQCYCMKQVVDKSDIMVHFSFQLKI